GGEEIELPFLGLQPQAELLPLDREARASHGHASSVTDPRRSCKSGVSCPPMRLTIREIHPASKPDSLNEEWFVVENPGDKAFSTAGCAVAVGRGNVARLRVIGTLDPGFTIHPGEKVRVITGNPGKKAHGTVVAEEGVRDYHLFLAERLLAGPGAVLGLSLKQ